MLIVQEGEGLHRAFPDDGVREDRCQFRISFRPHSVRVKHIPLIRASFGLRSVSRIRKDSALRTVPGPRSRTDPGSRFEILLPTSLSTYREPVQQVTVNNQSENAVPE